MDIKQITRAYIDARTNFLRVYGTRGTKGGPIAFNTLIREHANTLNDAAVLDGLNLTAEEWIALGELAQSIGYGTLVRRD